MLTITKKEKKAYAEASSFFSSLILTPVVLLSLSDSVLI
jgi:hypothetical protein